MEPGGKHGPSSRPEDLLAAADERLAKKCWSEALCFVEGALDERPGWIDALARALYAASKLEYADTFSKHARTTLALPSKSRPRLSDKKVGDLALAAGAHDIAAGIGRALIASERGVGPGSYLLASATWEAGEESAAGQVIADGLTRGGGASERAAIGYRLRLDDVDGAAAVLRASEAPDASASVAVAEGFQAQGDAVRAHETVEWARSRGMSAPRLDAVESAAGPVRRLIDGSWLSGEGSGERDAPGPSSGCVLHLVTRSLPYYTAGGLSATSASPALSATPDWTPSSSPRSASRGRRGRPGEAQDRGGRRPLPPHRRRGADGSPARRASAPHRRSAAASRWLIPNCRRVGSGEGT